MSGSRKEQLGFYLMCVCVLGCFSRVQLFAAPQLPITRQAPQSMGFPRQEYWSGLPFPTPGDLPNSGIQPVCLHLLHWQAGHSCINWGFSSLLVPDINFAPQASMGKKTLSLRIIEILHPPQQCSRGSYSEPQPGFQSLS